MPTARIYQRTKSSMSSGKARTDQWELEIEPSRGQEPDPLTGWAGRGDVASTEIKLRFPTLDAAKAHCEREGWAYHVVPAPERKLKLQAYADNFR